MLQDFISPRLRGAEVDAILGCSKSYRQSLIRRGLLTPHRESKRFVWYRRDEVLALARGDADTSNQTREPAPMLTEKPIPQIINEPQTSPKRRGRPRKVKMVVR